jgi:transposase
MMNVSQIFIGVDVSKNHLDVHIHSHKKGFRVANDALGIRKIITKLSKYNVGKIVCEASGGYEKKFVQMATQKGLNVWRVQPNRVKSFIASDGIKAKTDAIDARMLAKFAAEKECAYTPHLMSPVEGKLHEYTTCRAQLVQTAAAEKTKLAMITELDCRDAVKDIIDFIENKVKEIDKAIEALMKQDDRIKHRIEIAQSIPGIGKITANAIIAAMPELGSMNCKQVAALAGVAPYQNQSGKFERRAYIKAGRSAPRRAMYMAALTAISCNKIMKEFYERLISLGKAPKVALIAVMRKMFVILNAMLRDKVMWKEA